MNVEKIKADVEEMTQLSIHVARLESLLEKLVTVDCTSVVSIGLIEHNKPAREPEVHINGKAVDWSELGLPEAFKETPALIIPGAKLINPPKYSTQFDVEVRPTLLIGFLTFLRNQAINRIEILRARIAK